MTAVIAVGDLVTLPADGGGRQVGVVSRTISTDSAGHVLTVVGDAVVGREVVISEVELIDDEAEGFTQLAYQLNTLSSSVIERRLLIYGPDH